MHSGLLLIALGFGYKIFAEASVNPKKSMKKLGRLVGIVIMAVSFLGTLCAVSCAVRYGKMGRYGFGKKMCPATDGAMFSDGGENVQK